MEDRVPDSVTIALGSIEYADGETHRRVQICDQTIPWLACAMWSPR